VPGQAQRGAASEISTIPRSGAGSSLALRRCETRSCAVTKPKRMRHGQTATLDTPLWRLPHELRPFDVAVNHVRTLRLHLMPRWQIGRAICLRDRRYSSENRTRPGSGIQFSGLVPTAESSFLDSSPDSKSGFSGPSRYIRLCTIEKQRKKLRTFIWHDFCFLKTAH
jgi:hypothetical protein